MILDYLLQPLINTVWIATALHERYVQQVPFMVWALLIAGVMTVLNLIGVKASAKANKVLLAVMSVVVVAFIVLALKYLYGGQGWAGLFSLQPIYNPKTFDCAQDSEGEFVCSVDLHRLRWRDHTGRRCGESQAERSAGRGADLHFCRGLQRD